jgi:predicted methyltransferase
MKIMPLGLICTILLSACHSGGDSKPNVQQATVPDNTALLSVLNGTWRAPENKARDQYRHPLQTLQFFGVTPAQTLIEISPGGGWYTEILAPLLKDNGHYIGVINDPNTFANERSRVFYDTQNTSLRARIASSTNAFGSPTLVEIDPAAPELGASDSADIVLTFRNVHNWVMAGQEAAMFEAFFEVLKPGGILGVVEHRADSNAEFGKIKDTGYLPEEYVIGLALKAGFVLEARSEINANPKDTKDYPAGVWTLPPTFSQKEKDRARYLAIGESDRMTLRFKKPF